MIPILLRRQFMLKILKVLGKVLQTITIIIPFFKGIAAIWKENP